MFEDIDFKSKSRMYDPQKIIPGRKLEEQELDEDIFQVNYDIGDIHYTIDVGWYPSHRLNGSFMIVIVKNCDWDNYLYEKRTRDYNQLHKYMEECVTIVKQLLEPTGYFD